MRGLDEGHGGKWSCWESPTSNAARSGNGVLDVGVGDVLGGRSMPTRRRWGRHSAIANDRAPEPASRTAPFSDTAAKSRKGRAMRRLQRPMKRS